MSKKIDLKQIKEQARGRWLEVLPLADSRLSGACSSEGRAVPCPAGTGTRDGFRIPIGAALDGHAFHNQLEASALSDGFKVLMWLNDWTFYEALQAVNSAINGGSININSVARPVQQKKADYSKRKAIFKRWLNESSTTPNRPAIRYYIERGLLNAPVIKAESLRYIDAIPYQYDGAYIRQPDGALFTTPAILCGMRTDEKITGLSVIRIDTEGRKADSVIIDALNAERGLGAYSVQSKQLLTVCEDIRGGCWRLGEIGEAWNVGEGVETMLAVAGALKSDSIGACMTAAMLENLEIPKQVKILNIWTDKDRNKRGLIAANKLKERVNNELVVNILIPAQAIPEDEKGLDWLDCQRELETVSREV